MRVKIEYTVDAPDEYRRAINHHYGLNGMASRDDVKLWLRLYGSSCDDDLMHDLAMHSNREHAKMKQALMDDIQAIKERSENA